MSKDFYYRAFLNREEIRGGKAAIRIGEGTMQISDCTSSIELNFWCEDSDNEKEFKNVEHKIDILYEAVASYRRHLKAKIRRIRKTRVAS